MFREMRRKDRKLTEAEAIDILNRCEYGILSTAGTDGYPYGVPVDYAYRDNGIYFHCATVGQKLEAIENNSNVSFCVVTDVDLIPEDFSTRYKSVLIFGKARELFDEEKREGLMLILEKFSADFVESGEKYIDSKWDQTKMFRIEIEHMSAKGKK